MYFSSDQLYGTGTVWNVSIGGWRVDSDMTVEPGTALTLYIMLPDTKQAILVDKALVSWSRGKEFGLMTDTMKAPDASRLRDFVSCFLHR